MDADANKVVKHLTNRIAQSEKTIAILLARIEELTENEQKDGDNGEDIER